MIGDCQIQMVIRIEVAWFVVLVINRTTAILQEIENFMGKN